MDRDTVWMVWRPGVGQELTEVKVSLGGNGCYVPPVYEVQFSEYGAWVNVPSSLSIEEALKVGLELIHEVIGKPSDKWAVIKIKIEAFRNENGILKYSQESQIERTFITKETAEIWINHGGRNPKDYIICEIK